MAQKIQPIAAQHYTNALLKLLRAVEKPTPDVIDALEHFEKGAESLQTAIENHKFEEVA